MFRFDADPALLCKSPGQGAASMSSCPSTEQLCRLLDEQLDQAVEKRLVLHVEACASCQGKLLELVRNRLPNAPWSPGALTGLAENGVSSLVASRFDGDLMGDGPQPAEPASTLDATLDCVGSPELPATAAEMTGDGRSGHGGRTEAQSRALASSPVAGPDSCRSDRPNIPGYELIETLGEGGMGVVYKARQLGLNRLVALKMIIGGRHARADLLARFRIEAEAVARLRHPNILQIYDIGEVDGLPFVSLELLDGGGLDDRLSGTPQPGRSGAELVATLARAVHAAHQAGIVHRDLKPTNVLFTADGTPKITDFGLAKRLESDSQQTETGQIMGSPSYMAPEQARGQTKEVGPAADVYALGAILYETPQRAPPFKGETPIDTVRQVIDDDPVPPSRLVPRVARDVETICLKCLHKEPHKRYDSAQELALDLDRYRDGKPIKARRTPAWERGYKWSRRRPLTAGAVAFGIVGLLGATLAGVFYQRHEQFKKDQRNAWVFREQNREVELYARADEARTQEELQKVQVDLATFRQDVRDEPRLDQVSVRIGEKSEAVAKRLGILSSQEAVEKRDRVDREAFRKFLKLGQEAQFYEAGFVTTDRLKNISASAHAALAIYARESQFRDDTWALVEPLPGALTDTEKARVGDVCYDLLLIRSQAAGAAEGLRILDQAAKLRPRTTAAHHLRRADCLERAGDLAGRDREKQAAGQLKPVTALDYFLSGRELAFGRQFAAAVRGLKQALGLDRDQASAHLLLAVCYLNMQPKRLSEAESSLDSCVRSNPDVAGLYLLRALVFGEEGTQSLGEIEFERPGEASASPLKEQADDAFAAAEADYRRALDLKPNDDLRYVLLANRGLLRLQSDRLDLAVADLRAAIRLQPNQYQAHTTLGQVFLRKGRPDDAHAAFTLAIGSHPEPIVLAGLYRSRALLYAPRKGLNPEEREAALRDLDESLRYEPDKARQAGDHVWRARLFFSGGQSVLALGACDAALKLAPDDPEAHRVRISALMELKRYEEVLASSDAYFARGKPTSELLEIRGLAQVARRDYTAAIADFNRALELKPELEPARRSKLLNLRGWAYQFADAPRLALADFEESLRLDSNQSDAHGGRGLARIRLGQWRPAVSDAEDAVRLARVVHPATDGDRQAQVQACFNAARIYAMAVEFAAGDVSRQGERAVFLYRGYRSRALKLLEEALEQVPDREHREEILNDPALRSLRVGPSRSPGMRRSAGRGSRVGSASLLASRVSSMGSDGAAPFRLPQRDPLEG